MIIYTDPTTGNVAQCSLASSVPDGVAYKVVKSYGGREFREALTDVDAAGAPVFDLTKAKAIKVKESNQKCDDSLKVITDNYSEAEMKTWVTQELESRQYVADVLAGGTVRPTPFLGGLSAGTGVALSVLADKIILKADGFRLFSATAVGKRQAMENTANAATDIQTLKAVTF